MVSQKLIMLIFQSRNCLQIVISIDRSMYYRRKLSIAKCTCDWIVLTELTTSTFIVIHHVAPLDDVSEVNLSQSWTLVWTWLRSQACQRRRTTWQPWQRWDSWKISSTTALQTSLMTLIYSSSPWTDADPPLSVTMVFFLPWRHFHVVSLFVF